MRFHGTPAAPTAVIAHVMTIEAIEPTPPARGLAASWTVITRKPLSTLRDE
jgi:hypothetical protein